MLIVLWFINHDFYIGILHYYICWSPKLVTQTLSVAP